MAKEQTPEANTAEVEKSINAWRVSQGLPPRDQSKAARSEKDATKEAKKNG